MSGHNVFIFKGQAVLEMKMWQSLSRNCQHEEIKTNLNPLNTCYHLACNLFSLYVLSESIKTVKYTEA